MIPIKHDPTSGYMRYQLEEKPSATDINRIEELLCAKRVTDFKAGKIWIMVMRPLTPHSSPRGKGVSFKGI